MSFDTTHETVKPTDIGHQRGVNSAPPVAAPAVTLVSDYPGTIEATALPGSIERAEAPAIARRMVTRLFRSSAYTLASIPIFIAWILGFVLFFGTVFPLVFAGIGLLLLAPSLQAASIGGGVERWILDETMGETIERPKRLPTDRGLRGIFITPLTDTSYWRELLFVSLRIIIAPIAVLPLLTAIAGFGAATSIIWAWFIDAAAPDEIAFTFAVGLLVAFLSSGILIAMTSMQVALGRALLGPDKRALTRKANTAVRNRDLSVAAAEAERQRIERDLHDGAQARLATVALDLGRAKRRLEKDGGDAELGAIIDSAHADAKEAIVELRNLARGIHPAVLTDRGLDAALSEIAARCAVPVHLDVHMMARPAPHIESSAYFAVSELLTNITKHSRATQAWVTVRGTPTALRIDVSDNGIGGAEHALGSGLLGLHDRIRSIDGDLTMRSPLAGGTNALIEIPLEPPPPLRVR